MSATPLTHPEEISDLVKLMKIKHKYKDSDIVLKIAE
jgi:hypothetical protein